MSKERVLEIEGETNRIVFLKLPARDQEDLLRLNKLIRRNERISDIKRCEECRGLFVIVKRKKM